MLHVNAAIVVTTIFPPVFLDGFCSNFRKFGRESDVRIIVIPDRKTPESVFQACAQAAQAGYHVACPTLEEQTRFLARIGGSRRLDSI